MNICLSSSEIFKLHMMKIRSYKGVDMLARPLLNCCCQSWLVICCNVLHRTFEYTARKKNETYETCWYNNVRIKESFSVEWFLRGGLGLSGIGGRVKLILILQNFKNFQTVKALGICYFPCSCRIQSIFFRNYRFLPLEWHWQLTSFVHFIWSTIQTKLFFSSYN